jgi:hypothetical protein
MRVILIAARAIDYAIRKPRPRDREFVAGPFGRHPVVDQLGDELEPVFWGHHPFDRRGGPAQILTSSSSSSIRRQSSTNSADPLDVVPGRPNFKAPKYDGANLKLSNKVDTGRTG